jgi:hypothetical protein
MPSKSVVKLRLKCDGTCAETKFRLSTKRTSPFKSAGVSVQSTTGSRGVRISGSNTGYTMFRGSVKSNSYPLHSPVSPSLHLPCVTVCHYIFIWTLPELNSSCIFDGPVRWVLLFPCSTWRQRHMQLSKYCGIFSPRPWTLSKVSVAPMAKSAKSSKCESCDWFCYFTLMWPCIVTNFLILKPTRCTNFSNLFWNETLHDSDSSSVHHQKLFTVHSAMV